MTMTGLTALMVPVMLLAFFPSRPDVPLTEYRELEDLIKVQENLGERNTRRLYGYSACIRTCILLPHGETYAWQRPLPRVFTNGQANEI